MARLTEAHTFADLSSGKALVCRREINGEQGGATVYCVLAADGFLFDSFKVAVENGALVLSLKDAPTPSEKDAEDGIRR